MVKSIHWDVTSACNLRCKHCYNAEKYFTDKRLQELSEEDICKLIRELKREGFKHVHMLGGEPLYATHFKKTIQLLKSNEMIVTINSNGTLLDAEMREFLIQNKVEQYAASFDGCTPETNDAIRGRGSFCAAYENMKQLTELIKEKGAMLQTAIVFTLTKANIHELSLLPTLASELGVDLIVLTTFIESGNGKKNSDTFEISWNEVCNRIETFVAEMVSEIPVQIDMRPEFVEFLRYVYKKQIITNEKNNYCYAGKNMWYMEADGKMHPCLAYRLEVKDIEKRNALAAQEKMSIKNNSMCKTKESEYWRLFESFRDGFQVNQVPGCSGCNYLGQCKPCFLEYGDYSRSVPECDWTKQRIAHYMEQRKGLQYQCTCQEQNDHCKRIIASETGAEIVLQNEGSVQFWNMIKESSSVNEITQKAASVYDVPSNTLQYDLFWFLIKLLSIGALQWVSK